jgi:hypothetical protein
VFTYKSKSISILIADLQHRIAGKPERGQRQLGRAEMGDGQHDAAPGGQGGVQVLPSVNFQKLPEIFGGQVRKKENAELVGVVGAKKFQNLPLPRIGRRIRGHERDSGQHPVPPASGAGAVQPAQAEKHPQPGSGWQALHHQPQRIPDQKAQQVAQPAFPYAHGYFPAALSRMLKNLSI